MKKQCSWSLEDREKTMLMVPLQIWLHSFPPLLSAWTYIVNFPIDACPVRRHGSTRVHGHAFLAWRSSWRMVVYIYFITAAGNSVRSQLGSSCQGNRISVKKAGGTARPSCTKSHLLGHSHPVKPARRAAVLGQPSSLQPHWACLPQVNNDPCCTVGTLNRVTENLCLSPLSILGYSGIILNFII